MNSKWLSRWRYPQWGKASPTLHYIQQAKLLRTKRRAKWINTSERGTEEETDEWMCIRQGNMSASIPVEEEDKCETAMWRRNTPPHEGESSKDKYTEKNASLNNQLRKRYQGVQKKLYQKYNHQGIGSDPHKVQTYERNYEQMNELNIHRMLLLGLQKLHISELNKMQINSFLTIQQGKDVLINYPDGSGKTIAYLLPLLNNIYFVHDYLEELILQSYHEQGGKNKCGNSVQKNFKFNNNFDLYNGMRKYFLSYSHYRKNVLLEDDATQMDKKMNQKFHLLPNHFDQMDEQSMPESPHLGRTHRRRKKGEGKYTSTENRNGGKAFSANEDQTGYRDGRHTEGKQKTVSLMNKLIEVIKMNKINLNNINSDRANKEELAKLENILMYNFKDKQTEPNCIVTPPDNDECIYRYLTRNPLQINKPIIILTVNKDNICQIVRVIKQLDVLNRINIQTLNDVPYEDTDYPSIDERTHIESNNEEVDMQLQEKVHPENIHVVNVNKLPNPVLCKDEIMWTCVDIVITTPDIFLHAYQNERTKKILPSIIIFDEVDMLFQNNAYRNTMMNIFYIVNRRPEIYNPHIDISNGGLDNVATSIEAILRGDGVKMATLRQPQVSSTFPSALHSTVNHFERGQFGNLDMSPLEETKNGILTGDAFPNNTSHGKDTVIIPSRAKEKERELPLLQMIYVSSTLPSVGHTTAGSMLTERFNNLVEIVCTENYHIPRNVRTQWIELNRDKILSNYLLNGGEGATQEGKDILDLTARDQGTSFQNGTSETHHGGSLKDAALSSKINKLENSSFEHRLDLLIHVLKKYHEWSDSSEFYKQEEFSEHGQAEKNITTNPEGRGKKKKKNSAISTKGGKFHLIDKKEVYKTIVFVNSVKDCIRIYFFLKKHNWPVFCFHKNISINLRMQNLHSFHHAHVAILVTTDLLSRGIDTKNVDHIINFHFPSDAITYLHRLGKMNRSGGDHHNGLNRHNSQEKGQMRHRRATLEKEHIDGETQTKRFHGGDTTWEYIPTHGQDKDNTFPRKNKNFLVTNFLAFSNLPLAQSIRSCDKQNASLLPLFSRKKSFKMKIKRKENNALGEGNRYINVGEMEEDDIDMDGHFPNGREISTCENDEKNVYVQAPFSVFSLDDSGEESEKSDTDEEEVDEEYTDESTRARTKFDQQRAMEKGKTKTKHNPHVDDDHAHELPGETSSCEQKKSLRRCHQSRVSTGNTLPRDKIPSWDDVQFDNQKFLVERFKSRDCYLMGQVKRGKLIFNNFESNADGDDDEEELLF
ncbi:DEAD/DEAH box helicase, putative [Plasmodium knowlesi strain H]|uniref:DEAD/DEAH box helicase, putative n=3 Tax=Plasmodium knowlesi TaxID=5850 RepID=A0A5K1VQK8_PLAKH|nr:DEAD/DEAH box helicase, putative [Plasmodium knowlesi strain H]OTN64970.1 putative DEAD/DEAH box helicase [Plasmodium knowlesi]CAA9988092.1 DEAD/DEAH box helicase, putative [Plasmodium knowlesi strain H]SBO19956.1 DEAD/DEAH box helicase, putative [Plasmodium knowlesi strain H]SBO29096.1 DEAD/DEAH box helicase, putative [Plasmodium knowlesi strain H]VVS77566.1 DEAD/DEAH box helicase, putative [Plasmodium knowlesi strain H]|eukprot:XP_002259066.1 helicase, putative [Plasmodium knowlesi strain H]